MTQLTINSQVADIVTSIPKSSDLFRKLCIDFCCGGKVALKEAAEARDLDPEEILNQINTIDILQENDDAFNPTSFGNKTLVAYIQEKYHESLRTELPALSQYVSTIVNVHGDWQPYLYRVQEIFEKLSAELLDHTKDEDINVFPLILEFLNNPTDVLKEKINPHVFELEEEHETAGRLLFELREITDNFSPPSEACATYSLVYARLEQLEKDTFNHVHLENNILFDRVRKLI